MSTLSHNRGQERTHDPDQNTPQTLCPQRNREALVNTRQLAQNPHSVRTLAGLKTKIITDSCPSTIESWPTAGQPRHHFEVWSQTRIGIKIHSETWLALASDVLPWTNPRNPPQKTKLTDLNCSTYRRNEENLRRSTSSNPQENYQNTTASSLFCKTANDQVISKSDAASVTNDWQHPTKLFKFYFELQHPTPFSEILKDDFKLNFNQANYKWPLWTFFKISLEKYVETIPHILPYGLKPRKTLAHSITLSLNYIFHDCVLTDTALLDVMYV